MDAAATGSWTERRRRVVAAAFVAGLVVRVWALPLWGTFDNEVQKAWSARAATAGLADIYGPSDRELVALARARDGAVLGQLATMPYPKTRFEWGTATYFVDYPPGSVLVLWAAGEAYARVAPGLPNRRGFNAAINVAPLLASLAIAALLFASAPRPLGGVRALAFWLNPAVILAAPVLGYQDTIFAAFALAAVTAMVAGRLAAATVLVVLSGLVKPQGVLLLPTLAVLLVRDGRPAVWLKAALGGLAASAAVLAPWWTQGHLLSALDGCRRPLGQGTLAPLGYNVWWIAGWIQRWGDRGPWPLAEIVTIDEFGAWAGFDPRLVSRVLLLVATVAVVAFLACRLRAGGIGARSWAIPLSVVLQVHAYALVGTSVHENHTFLAVVLAPLLVGAWPRSNAVLAGTSGFLLANLFLAAGFGRRITSQRFLQALRAAPGLDLTVAVAAAHAVLVGLLAAWAAGSDRRFRGADAAAGDARIRTG
jgi:hypothetical protein